MASFLQIENLTKSYGDRMLFEDITFGVNEGDKIGIIAKNGTGKSTLLRIIAGIESPDSGSVIFRQGLKVGILEQLPQFDPDASVAVSCMSGDSPLLEVIASYEKAMADGNPDAITAASQLMDASDAWTYEDRMRQLLSQLNIHNLSERMGNLSGGQRKRVAIARMLLDNPDLIILDEPTNHLDIEIVEWLESYLTRSRVTLLMVTHDRYFLDRVCNKIIEMDHRTIFTYQGNYDLYLRRRAERIEALEGELAKVKNTLRREQEWMSRQPQARAGKAKYRIDAFYDLKDKARADYSERHVKLDVKSSYIGSKIFEAQNVSKKFGDKVILSDFTYTFARYERLGVIGGNGVGKSTFIKMLQGIVPADSGEWNVGETVKFGYYSQDGIKFDENKRVIDAVTEIAEDIVLNGGQLHFSPMQFLNRFLFSPADQQKFIRTLSGGEKCRLHLAVVLMRSPNFLILDEPTNDLDIVTLGILEEYLSTFKGCMIVISHDRYFLDNVVDHLFVFQGDGQIKDFPGNYSDYRQWMSVNAQGVKKVETDKPKAVEKPRQERKAKMSFKERKEFEALTDEIDSLTKEKNELDTLFASGQTINDVASLSKRYDEIAALLDEKEMRWLELSEKE